MSYPSSRIDTPELIRGQDFCITQIIGLWCGRKIVCYIRAHNINQWAHSKHSCLRAIHRIYVYIFPTFSKRRYFIEVTLPDNLCLALCMAIKSYKFIPFRGSKVIKTPIVTLYTFAFAYFIDLIRRAIARNLPALNFIAPSAIDYSNANYPLLNHSQTKSLIHDLASIPAEQFHQIFIKNFAFDSFIDSLQNFINANPLVLTQPVFISHIIQVLHRIEKNIRLTQDPSHPFNMFLSSFSSLKQQILTKIFNIEEIVIPSTEDSLNIKNTVFYTVASYLIWTNPHANIVLYDICFSYIKNNKLNCSEITCVIHNNQLKLNQLDFIKHIIQLIDKIDATALILQNGKDSKYENLLFFNSYLEKSLLIFISNDHSKELEVIQWVKNRINTDNITYYLSMCSLGPNIILSIACTAYLEKNKPLPKNCQEHLIKSPRNALFILNAGCLAKDDLVVKTVWEIIFLNKTFEIFKTDEKITSLDYLLNKKEFSNQTLIVGDSQNPQEILVNREILSQRNRYFHALFQTNFSEGSQDVIMLKNQDTKSIDYEGFLYLLRYIYTGNVDVPLDLCLTVSHLADLYLEPNLKKTCDKKKWDQAVLTLKHKNLTGKFQSSHYEEFFYLVHEIYTGKTDASSVITLKDLNIENLQNIDYQAVLYLLHYIYTSDEDVPSSLCLDVSRLADAYLEPDLKKACDQKILQLCIA